VAASAKDSNFTTIPAASSWKLSRGASYVHICSNETITAWSSTSCPTSRPWARCAAGHRLFLARGLAPIDWSRVGLAFGGAQKNIGPAGLTIVIVREDLLGHALPVCPRRSTTRPWPTTAACTTRRPPGASTWPA
jgi:phosphoserine aminotransferase